MMSESKTTKTYWAGFIDGNLFEDIRENGMGYKMAEVFTTKSGAKCFFEDVRKVKIVEVNK